MFEFVETISSFVFELLSGFYYKTTALNFIFKDSRYLHSHKKRKDYDNYKDTWYLQSHSSAVK